MEELNYQRWARPGIRVQLLDITKKKLEMDFVLEGDDRSMHVLNAVSLAFTCSLPFADPVCDHIDKAVGYRLSTESQFFTHVDVKASSRVLFLQENF
ncbi:hypothetical protein YTPLAS72_13760 [Nitrospira sp.]|nr:hypothetical protein YTPLAS72_13760 [Nitrospira sp.]